ncbi:MTRF1L release factor glutamine methyltransferase isoform X3 [Phasianus colchicus]|uniref:MTRF1L release factor glutamine methyltransferase isoform X3 n=1 Tax=Phasianus colchicus TaxID=9054 RepID=UPI00129D83A4|nr:MTRF1L release factor glutamine methyltransferase isoform X3 [Phasianus colchicus]
MRCFSPSLFRQFWGLLPQYVSVGPSRNPNLSPKQSSLRKNCSARPRLMTAPDVVSYWQNVFEKNGIPEARESSEYIVSFVLGAKTFQSLDSKKLCAPLTAVQQEQIQQLSCKRLERCSNSLVILMTLCWICSSTSMPFLQLGAQHWTLRSLVRSDFTSVFSGLKMPVQYVLGEWDFQDLNLKMRPPVFIPRPETEDLISLIVEEESRKCEAKNSALSVAIPSPVILEVGCGSGAIALSLLCKIPQSRVLAVDKEETAVDLTRENVHRFCQTSATLGPNGLHSQ